MVELKEIDINAFKKATANRNRRNNLLILIVEDQRFSRILLRSYLSKEYEVIEASDGEQGLVEYMTRSPDIVFLDIELPKVNGHKVAELISKLDKDSFIIMVTANNHTSDVMKAKENNVKGFIVKPYTKAKINEAVEIFLKQHLK